MIRTLEVRFTLVHDAVSDAAATERLSWTVLPTRSNLDVSSTATLIRAR